MSYATPENVKSLFRNFADTTEAAVTDAEIQEFLDDAAEIIDAKIGTIYLLPITVGENPKAFKVLRRLETFKVAAVVDDILNNYSEADKKPMWDEKGNALMKELVPKRNAKGVQPDPTMKLSDATYLGTATQKNRVTLSKTSGTIFKKGVDTW